MSTEILVTSIYDYLVSESDFTDLVDSGSLGFSFVDQSVDYPKVVFKKISNPRIVDATDEWQRWRFYITCTKNIVINSQNRDGKFMLINIADVLTNLLNQLYGDLDSNTKLDFVKKLDESEIELRDDNVYEMYIDFRILYH